MKNNWIFKILASFPMIFVMLYFIPFLGICLILFRYFIYNDRRKIDTPIILIVIGLLILVPKLVYLVLDLLKYDFIYLNNIINSNLYNVNLINYSKLLISVGVIFLIVLFVFSKIFDKVCNYVRNYISKTEERNINIAKENDMAIKIKQEKAKNTSYVKCPNCGSDNIISEKFGTCKYCRGKLVNKVYKNR